MTLLVEEAHRQNYVLEDTGDAKGDHNNGDAPADEEKYEGATVLEPQAGMYLDPIVCLDFAALYPSLLRTFTGCVSTYVKDPGAIQTPTYTVPNTKHSFVTSEVTRGLIPRILDNLTLARQSAKRDMKNAPTPELRSLYNYRQLALKISANSIYGFTGCKRGQLSAVEVAESTTGLGRHVIELTAKYVERTYPGAKVVYGDTDSVFVRLPEEMRSLPVSDIFPLGHRWAKEVTTHIASTFPFRSYIELEFEKVLSPLILWRKKRYSGLCYEEPDTPTLLVKGIELVRRDSLPIVKTIQREILEKLLYSRDADGAQLLIKQAVDTVLAVPAGGPFDAVVQSKSLRGAYKNEEGMAHVQVKKLMDERSAGSGPKVGDRVSYIVCSSSATRIVDRAEDPAHASTIGLSIDYLHYVTAIETPLLRLVEIPLRQLSVGLYEGLEAFMVRALNRARAQCALATRCRVGTVWKDGHLAKDGLVQRTLVCSEPPAEIAAKRKRQKRDGSAVERGEQRPISDYFVKAPAPETATPLPPALPQ
jgi:DNA polymerase delta subunit 1